MLCWDQNFYFILFYMTILPYRLLLNRDSAVVLIRYIRMVSDKKAIYVNVLCE